MLFLLVCFGSRFRIHPVTRPLYGLHFSLWLLLVLVSLPYSLYNPQADLFFSSTHGYSSLKKHLYTQQQIVNFGLSATRVEIPDWRIDWIGHRGEGTSHAGQLRTVCTLS